MFKHWMRHTAMVPKGFLRFYVLKLLSEKPMSGSEIMQEIEKMSRGNWKPSPGSIYPLMAWLQDKGYVEETPAVEKGIKRYALTEQGKEFLVENAQRREDIQRRFRFIGPPFFPGPPPFEFFCGGPRSEGVLKLRDSAKGLMVALWKLRENLNEKYSEDAANRTKAVLEGAAKKIDEINKEFQN
jgi:DNA-binding PadR family transcriptional regulator